MVIRRGYDEHDRRPMFYIECSAIDGWQGAGFDKEAEAIAAIAAVEAAIVERHRPAFEALLLRGLADDFHMIATSREAMGDDAASHYRTIADLLLRMADTGERP